MDIAKCRGPGLGSTGLDSSGDTESPDRQAPQGASDQVLPGSAPLGRVRSELQQVYRHSSRAETPANPGVLAGG